jgi:hypothetical protein
MGERRYSATILNLDTGCRRVVSFILCRFISRETAPLVLTYRRELCSRAGLNAIEKRRITWRSLYEYATEIEKHVFEHENQLKAIILSRVGVTYETGFGLDDWIYCILYIHTFGTAGNTALSLIYTLYSSPLHTH